MGSSKKKAKAKQKAADEAALMRQAVRAGLKTNYSVQSFVRKNRNATAIKNAKARALRGR